MAKLKLTTRSKSGRGFYEEAVVLALCCLATPLAAAAGELSDAFAPIQDSTAHDPAGLQLMIACICLLVALVFSIFIGTMFYMFKGTKKTGSRSTAVEKERPEGAEPVALPESPGR